MVRLIDFFWLEKKVLRAAISAVRPPELLSASLTPLRTSSPSTIVIMFKPSQPMMARLRLTTKQVNGGYYKGTRTGSMGHFDKKGNYVIDWKKVRTYVVPENLKDFKVCVLI